jgi:hypothetical protein
MPMQFPAPWALVLLLTMLAAPHSGASAAPEAAGSESGESSKSSHECPLPGDLSTVTGHILVRVTANEKGQVLFVKDLYATIEPSKIRKSVVKSLKQCLGRRTFPEAVTQAGYAIRTDFLLAFHYFPPVRDDAPRIQISPGRRVPEQWLEEMREERNRLADSLLVPSYRTESSGAGWRLHTDVTPGFRQTIETALRFAEEAFNAAFPGSPQVPEASPVTIFVFRNEDRLQQVAAFDNIYATRAGLRGQYDSRDQTIVSYAGLETPEPEVAGTIAHEATHHFVSQRLYDQGRRNPSFWVTEGIAVMIQCLDPDDIDGLSIARFRRGRMFKGAWQWKAPAEEHIDNLEAGLRRNDLEHVGPMLRGEGNIRLDLAYATSWLLAHYLMNADGGSHRDAFRAWMAGPEGEDGNATSLADALGMTIDELEGALRTHMQAIF